MKTIVNASGVLALIAVLLAIAILQMITPSTEAVRVRNSLIFDVADMQTIQWTPSRYPTLFKLDTLSPPTLFQVAIARIERSETSYTADFDLALAIGKYLAVGKIKGGAIQSDTVSTFKTIMDEGTGYCADFTQVFNGLAHAATLPVREWGMSFDGFGGSGHAFNEVFDREMGQWIFIDTFYSFYVIDRISTLPMSALGFRDRLMDRSLWASIQVVPISDVRFGFKSEKHALEYYYRGVDEFYLWWGNNVFQYDDSSLVQWASKISRSTEQAIAILAGVHPQIRIPRLPENEAAVASLSKVKRKFLTLFSIEVIVFGALLVQLASYFHRKLLLRRSSRQAWPANKV